MICLVQCFNNEIETRLLFNNCHAFATALWCSMCRPFHFTCTSIPFFCGSNKWLSSIVEWNGFYARSKWRFVGFVLFAFSNRTQKRMIFISKMINDGTDWVLREKKGVLWKILLKICKLRSISQSTWLCTSMRMLSAHQHDNVTKSQMFRFRVFFSRLLTFVALLSVVILSHWRYIHWIHNQLAMR